MYAQSFQYLYDITNPKTSLMRYISVMANQNGRPTQEDQDQGARVDKESENGDDDEEEEEEEGLRNEDGERDGDDEDEDDSEDEGNGRNYPNQDRFNMTFDDPRFYPGGELDIASDAAQNVTKEPRNDVEPLFFQNPGKLIYSDFH